MTERCSRILLAWSLAVLVAAGFAALRVHLALDDPNFDRTNGDGVLRSDPALLYYITERIVEAGGLPPLRDREA